MANTITKAVNYLADPQNMNAVYKAASKTVDLEANQIEILGANVVKLPKYSFGNALGTYDRDTGFVANDITKAWDTYTLSQDKGNKLLLDAMDDEESRGEGIVKAVNEYIRQIVTPAIDTYRFSVLVAGTGTTRALTLTDDNIVDELLRAEATLTENEVPEDGRIIYMTAAKLNLLQSSADITKYLGVREEAGAVNLKVKTFNGAKIVTVSSGRLGADVEFLYIHPSAAVSCVKHNPAYFFAAGTHTGPDADLVNYRLYYDLFVVANKTKGIYLQTVTES
jgi:hypothetical protein